MSTPPELTPKGWLRRRWFQQVGAGAAAAATTTVAKEASAFSLLTVPEALPPEQRVASYCELCFWGCSLFANVRAGRILDLEGNPNDPKSQGRLCGRGNAGAGTARSPHRLQYPMRRVGPRGEGKFERIGWPEAYREIAKRTQGVIDQHGAQSLALFYHGTGGAMMRTLLVALGSPNFAGPSYAQCKAPRDVGFKLTFGTKLTSPEPLDFDHTQCMVFFGSHLGENAHNSQVQEYVRARARGAKLIVLDPRMSTVASQANEWLALQPGSDTAILLAWIRALIEEDAYHRPFVEAHCVGLEELRAGVSHATFEWAAAQSGVGVAQLRRAYELLRDAKPAVLVHPGRHTSWYGEADTQRARAQAILVALLGAWGAPGGYYLWNAPPTLSELPTPDFPELPPHVDAAAKRYPFAQEVTTNGIRAATVSGKPYPVRAWWVHGTNLLQSMPNVAETLAAIQKLDFLLVTDVEPTEITRYADILLPEDTYLERADDLKAGGGRTPTIAVRDQVVPSPFDTRPAWRIAQELAREFGKGEYFPFATFDEYVAARLQGTGVALEQLRKQGIVRLPSKVKPYLSEGEAYEFHTPSGKVELASPALQAKGFSAVPKYVPQPAPPPGMVRLTYGRSPLHTFGRTQNIDILHATQDHNCVWLHPDDAQRFAVAPGQWCLVENGAGRTTGKVAVKVSERIQPGTLYMVHGFGHHAPAYALAHERGAADSDVIENYVVDPISGATGMRTEFVRVLPLTGQAKEDTCATGC